MKGGHEVPNAHMTRTSAVKSIVFRFELWRCSVEGVISRLISSFANTVKPFELRGSYNEQGSRFVACHFLADADPQFHQTSRA